MADRRLNGFNPLSYLGTNPYTPADTVVHTVDPTSTDSKNFELGTFWLNTVNESLWVLVNLNQGVATWVELSIGSGGTLDKLRTSDGNDVTPTAGRINLANGANITTTGTVGPNTVTISVSGTTNHSLQLGNSTGSLTSLGVATNGQLPIGSTGADPVLSTLTAGSGITITNGAGSITVAASGTMATTYHTDSGNAAPAANILNIITNNAAINAGKSVLFSGSGNTVTFNVTDADSNTTIGKGIGTNFVSPTAAQNTAVGFNALLTTTTGSNNCAIGVGAIGFSTTAFGNNGVGVFVLNKLTTGALNDAYGINAGWNGVTGLTTGSYNVLIGGGSSSLTINSAGWNYTGSESSNVLIRNAGVTGDNNIIRIGTSGSGNAQQNKCFIAGINGVNVGSVASVLTNSGDQLGTATITAGTGITVTPGANTITISASGTMTLTYTNVNSSPYVVLTTDEYLGVDCSGGAITVQLPNAPSTGRVFNIKDRTGSAATHNITVTTVGGVVNIDGATSFVMNTNFESINVLFDGTTYQVY